MPPPLLGMNFNTRGLVGGVRSSYSWVLILIPGGWHSLSLLGIIFDTCGCEWCSFVCWVSYLIPVLREEG